MADSKLNIILGAKDEASKVVGGLRGQFDKFKKDAVTGFGLGAGISVFNMAGRALGNVVDYMGDAVNMASDLVEQQGKVDIVFGESADSVREWAAAAADSIGMSERAALEAAGTFGAMFDAMDITGDEAADLSIDIVNLAGDLGAFFNVATDDALMALRSGLVGEVEPLRRFGVLLNAAAVEEQALAMGLAKTKGEITEQMKVMARWALITDQTSIAHGNFADTSDNLAGAQKRLNAAIENLQTSFGAFVYGPLSDAVDMLADFMAGPSDPAVKFRAWADSVKVTTEEQKELNTALKDTGIGLGTIEDMAADTPLGFLAPDLAEATKEWREHHKVLQQAGLDYYTWKDVFSDLQDSLGITAQEAIELTLVWARQEAAMNSAADATEDLDDRSAAMARRMRAEFGGLRNVTDPLREDFRSLPPVVAKMTKTIVSGVADLPPSLKATIRDGKADVREAMTELRWAMEHPFAGERYIKFLQQKQEAANRKLVRAIAAGKVEAANGLALYVDALQLEMDRLDDMSFSVNVYTNVYGQRRAETTPGRQHGGPVEAGQTYLVGEKGPELLRMGSTGGTVVPNAASGFGPIVVNIDGHQLFTILDRRMGDRYSLSAAGSLYRSS